MWLAILRPLLAPLLRLLGALGLYAKGHADARSTEKRRAAEAYAKTRKRLDAAEAPMDDNPDYLRKLLRERDADQR